MADGSYYGRFQDFFDFAIKYLEARGEEEQIMSEVMKYAQKFYKLHEAQQISKLT